MEKELQLQPRLQCIASLVPQGARLADVGTDHGYLPVWLLQHGALKAPLRLTSTRCRLTTRARRRENTA